MFHVVVLLGLLNGRGRYSLVSAAKSKSLSSGIARHCWWLGMLQIGIRAKVSTLSLNGLVKWSLDPRFQEEIVSGGPISNPRTFLSAKKLPWPCYEAQEE
jgi:hypothetical protein